MTLKGKTNEISQPHARVIQSRAEEASTTLPPSQDEIRPPAPEASPPGPEPREQAKIRRVGPENSVGFGRTPPNVG
jgi:hypothetical protein